MTNNLKCCFCGAELTINPHPFDGCVKARCVNFECRYAEWTFPLEIWKAIIDGKAAQDALKEAIKCINWTIDTIVKGLDREYDIAGCCELTLERINEITKQENE